MQHSAQKFPHTILILYQFTNMVLPTSTKHPSAEFLISAELCDNVPFFQPCKISHCGRPQQYGAAWVWLSLLPDEINDNGFFKSLKCCLVHMQVSSETEKECEWGCFFFSLSQYSLFLLHFLELFFFLNKFYILDQINAACCIKRSEIFRYLIESSIHNSFLYEAFLRGDTATEHFLFLLTNNATCRSWAVPACMGPHRLRGILCWKFHRALSQVLSVICHSVASFGEFCWIPHGQNEQPSAVSRPLSTVFPLKTFNLLSDELEDL